MALRIRVYLLSPAALETELNHANYGEREAFLKKRPLKEETRQKVGVKESC